MEQPYHSTLQVPVPKAGASNSDLHKPEGRGSEHILPHTPLAGVIVADPLFDGGKQNLEGVDQPVAEEDEDEEQPGPVASDDTDFKGDGPKEGHKDDLADRVHICDGVLTRGDNAIVGDEEGDCCVQQSHAHSRLPEDTCRQTLLVVVHLDSSKPAHYYTATQQRMV